MHMNLCSRAELQQMLLHLHELLLQCCLLCAVQVMLVQNNRTGKGTKKAVRIISNRNGFHPELE